MQLLQDLHKLAVLKYMYAADGGRAHWRHSAAYLNSGNVDRMIRETNHRSPLPLAWPFLAVFLYSSSSLQIVLKVKPNQGLCVCVDGRQQESGIRKGICHFKQIGLEGNQN